MPQTTLDLEINNFLAGSFTDSPMKYRNFKMLRPIAFKVLHIFVGFWMIYHFISQGNKFTLSAERYLEITLDI